MIIILKDFFKNKQEKDTSQYTLKEWNNRSEYISDYENLPKFPEEEKED